MGYHPETFKIKLISNSLVAVKPRQFWIGICLTALLAAFQPVPDSPAAILSAKPVSASAPALFDLRSGGHIPMPVDTPAAHASHLVALPDTHTSSLAAAWFAGERESAPDVRIAFSHFDRELQQWAPARIIATREAIGTDLGYGIRRLGNPVLWLDADKRMHMYVVGTGLGGWAAARIIHLTQTGDPHALDAPHFVAKQTLPLSWLWNTSHLVRNSPLPLANGGMALPAYFELGAKYPVLARISGSGEFEGVSRISRRRNLLQPAIVPVSDLHWRAYMRAAGGAQRIAVAETRNGGRGWSDLPDLPLSNPNAAVAALQVGRQTILAFNPEPGTRSVLALAASDNDNPWTVIHELERGKPTEEFSYPSLAWADDYLWVSYTDRRAQIAWQRFRMKD